MHRHWFHLQNFMTLLSKARILSYILLSNSNIHITLLISVFGQILRPFYFIMFNLYKGLT